VLGGFDLGPDYAPAPIVADRGRQIDGRDAERGSELDDRPGPDRTRREVEEFPLLRRDGDEALLHRLGRHHIEELAAADETAEDARREADEPQPIAPSLRVEISQRAARRLGHQRVL
jgi:hypothetical protein